MNTKLKLTDRGWLLVGLLGATGLMGVMFLVGTLEANL